MGDHAARGTKKRDQGCQPGGGKEGAFEETAGGGGGGAECGAGGAAAPPRAGVELHPASVAHAGGAVPDFEGDVEAGLGCDREGR